MTADSQSSKELNTALSEKECREYRTIFRHTPEVLQIELTDRCNAGCIMCSHYYKKNIGAGDLRDGVLEKIEPLLENCRLMLLNGYGEPFISGKYRQCMDLLKRYDVKAFDGEPRKQHHIDPLYRIRTPSVTQKLPELPVGVSR